jgi:hypothetical protein
MHDNNHDDSPANPFPNRGGINPDLSEATELHRCDIFNRRRPCGLNSLTVPGSLPARCRNEPGQTTLSELEWRSFEDSWEKEGCHEATYPSPITTFLDRRHTDSNHARLTELTCCNISNCCCRSIGRPPSGNGLILFPEVYKFFSNWEGFKKLI